MGAIAGHVSAFARVISPRCARVARAGSDVKRVEQERKAFVENLVAGIVWHLQKSLEKTGDVRAMPFGRAGVGYRLHDLVLGQQMRGALFGLQIKVSMAQGKPVQVACRDSGISPQNYAMGCSTVKYSTASKSRRLSSSNGEGTTTRSGRMQHSNSDHRHRRFRTLGLSPR